ncbi:MAG: beta-ketoacyl-ACP synthase II [Kineosporiaceae bacterium]|nr:beta-ketoacyl-ACP synthase II [Kineosporiaceae bacterium]MBK7624387.1 beta-ketoacyl-ACP synthase II [Kineosporiaceae bacterium]
MASETSRRVVVTGLGATTPLGGDVASTWSAALAGTSGARPLEQDWVAEYDMPVTFAAQLAVSTDQVLSRGQRQRLDPSGQMALIAAKEAWADAGAPEMDGDRLGVVIASGIGGVWTLLSSYDTLKEKGPRRVFPLTVPMLMPNGPAAAVSLELGARAGVHTPVSACASGAESVAYAIDMIRNGRADVVVAGGTEACIHPLPIAGFAAMQALSTRNDDPQAASRPYDTGRDGFVIGEGSAVLVLESEEHARARGAKIYAEAASAGLTSDAHHIAAPDPAGTGAGRAMAAALTAAGLTASDICHVNAHATSTPAGDIAESAAIRSVLGEAADSVAVTATKSMTGHLLGAAGALESLFTVLALHERQIPPTINLDDQDPEITLNVVRKAPLALGEGDLAALNNSFGFGGHNVALLFRTV